jgi:hypothetical protein
VGILLENGGNALQRKIDKKLNGVRGSGRMIGIHNTWQQSGANVIQAGTTCEALGQFEQARAHLLLRDTGLPDLDNGYPFLEAIRTHASATFIAVALTAHATLPGQRENVAVPDSRQR